MFVIVVHEQLCKDLPEGCVIPIAVCLIQSHKLLELLWAHRSTCLCFSSGAIAICEPPASHYPTTFNHTNMEASKLLLLRGAVVAYFVLVLLQAAVVTGGSISLAVEHSMEELVLLG